MSKPGSVYILASRRNGTLYIGVTSDLVKRVHQHGKGQVAGFSSKYGVHRLVYYEVHDRIGDAIRREKAMKKWRRQWKIELIEVNNPEWDDLYPALTGFPLSRE
jgi:putative endonuclease